MVQVSTGTGLDGRPVLWVRPNVAGASTCVTVIAETLPQPVERAFLPMAAISPPRSRTALISPIPHAQARAAVKVVVGIERRLAVIPRCDLGDCTTAGIDKVAEAESCPVGIANEWSLALEDWGLEVDFGDSIYVAIFC